MKYFAIYDSITGEITARLKVTSLKMIPGTDNNLEITSANYHARGDLVLEKTHKVKDGKLKLKSED